MRMKLYFFAVCLWARRQSCACDDGLWDGACYLALRDTHVAGVTQKSFACALLFMRDGMLSVVIKRIMDDRSTWCGRALWWRVPFRPACRRKGVVNAD